MKFEQELMQRLEQLKNERKTSQLAEKAGIDQSNISRALGKQKQQLGLDKISKLLDAMGARVVFPDQDDPSETREVCFVNTRIVNAEENAPPIIPEDYLAVPLVSESRGRVGDCPL